MNRMLLWVAAFAVPAMAGAQAQAPAKPDLARAQQIVEQVCAACHGADGNSPTAANPNLAGQGADYITLQLAHFKSGVRANPVMQGMSASLTPAEMQALGVYFSQQKPKGLTAKDPALVKVGQQIWRGGDATTGVPACASCHSPNGAGIPRRYPRLAGQWADYTLAQLKAFQSGERGLDKAGKDANGRVMQAVAHEMTEAQMRAVADYAAGLR